MNRKQVFSFVIVAMMLFCSLQSAATVFFMGKEVYSSGTLTDNAITSGTVTYDKETNTFTMDNAKISSTSQTSAFTDGNYGTLIHVVVKGTCEIYLPSGWGISSWDGVIIEGTSTSDKLTISTNGTCLQANKYIDIRKCTISASTPESSCIKTNHSSYMTSVTFTDCKVTLSSPEGTLIERVSGVYFDGTRITSPDVSTIYLNDYGSYRKTDGSRFYSMTIDLVQPTDNIIFEDNAVKTICVTNWDTNGDGELSYGEAAAVTDISTTFRSKSYIKKFNELQYFKGLTSIPAYAFYLSSNLTSVSIPKTVTSIGARAFYNESNLAQVNFPSGNTLRSIGMLAFANCTSIVSITGADSLTSISEGAFYNCTALATFKLPNTLLVIGKEAFASCSKLNTTVPSSVWSIDQEAFSGCTALVSSQTLGKADGELSLGQGVFNNCPFLSKIVIDVDEASKITLDGCFYGGNSDDFKCYVSNHTFNKFYSQEWTDDQKQKLLPYIDLGAKFMAPICCEIDIVPQSDLSYYGNVFRIISNYEKPSSTTVNAQYTEVPRANALPAGTPAICYTYNEGRVYFEHPTEAAKPLGLKNLMVGTYEGCYSPVNTSTASYYLWSHGDRSFTYTSPMKPYNKVRPGCAYLAIPEALDRTVVTTINVNGVDPTGGKLLSGDVNGDGVVNTSDVTALINKILGTASWSDTDCDVDGNGVVNTSDVTALINLILG